MTVKFAALAVLLLTPTAGAADVLIDLAPGGPKVVRVETLVDGQPIGPLWDSAVNDLFAFFDVNRDGKLDRSERERLVALTGRTRMIGVPDRGVNEFGFVGALTFDPKAEFVDRAAFAAALRAAGFGPVTVVTQPRRPENPALTAALFKRLDADADGKLSSAELKSARTALTPLDVNEDEWLSVPELLGRAVSGVQRNPPTPPAAGNTAPDWLVLQGDEAEAVKTLLLRGGAKATTLTARDLGLDSAAFKKHDANADGKLDATELATWLRQPPDSTLTIALSSKLGASRVTPTDAAMTPDGRQVTFTGESGAATNARRRDALLRRFAQARGSNSSPFGVPDWPGQTPGAGFAAAYAKFAASSVTLEVTDRGRSLYDWLDADGNGQLSPRELNAAAGRFPRVPISPGGVPRQVAYRAFCVGQPVPDPGGLPPEPREPGATWFLRMDRNGDGDVSLREFLGPLDRFRKLDADGDGLISLAESLKP